VYPERKRKREREGGKEKETERCGGEKEQLSRAAIPSLPRYTEKFREEVL